MNEYEPELGQVAFGQPFKQYEASNLLIASLDAIKEELARVYWNKHQKQIEDPFGNYAGKYKNDIFEVESYSWNDEVEQPYNFKYKDIEISWYKYLGRGTSVNKELLPQEINDMLNDCLNSLSESTEESQ